MDYIGIIASNKLPPGSTNSHFYLKSVAEELRAMAIELDLVVWSAMQLTRSGMTNSDPELTDIAESIGIPAVCDFMLAVTRTEEMDLLGQLCFKQLKNRFRVMTYKQKFILGVDFEQQQYFDINQNEQGAVSHEYVKEERVKEKLFRKDNNMKEKFRQLKH